MFGGPGSRAESFGQSKTYGKGAGNLPSLIQKEDFEPVPHLSALVHGGE